jgi:hypothetical protein
VEGGVAQEGRPEARTTGEGDWICPECGRRIRSEREMGRTRRRWGWAVVACVMGVVGGGVGLTPKVAEGGWVGLVPTDVLVRVAPMEEFDEFAQWMAPRDQQVSAVRIRLAGELFDRLGDLKPRHWRVLVDRHHRAFPELAEQMVVTRERWPEGEPILASLNAPWLLHFHGPTGRLRVRLRETAGGGPGKWLLTGRSWPEELGLPPPGAERVSLEAEYITMGKALWYGDIEVATRIGGSIEDVLEPVQGRELTETLVREMGPVLVVMGDGRGLRFRVPKIPDPTDASYVALGLRFCLYADGVLVGEAAYTPARWERVSSMFSFREYPQRDIVEFTFTKPMQLSDRTDSRRWEVVMEGDAALALRDFETWQHPALWIPVLTGRTRIQLPTAPTTYWSGRVRIPVEQEPGRWQRFPAEPAR